MIALRYYTKKDAIIRTKIIDENTCIIGIDDSEYFLRDNTVQFISVGGHTLLTSDACISNSLTRTKAEYIKSTRVSTIKYVTATQLQVHFTQHLIVADLSRN